MEINMKEVYREVGDRVFNILAPLNPEQKGNYILVDCPGCGHREAFTYLNPDCFTITCNRKNECGCKRTYLQYVTNSLSPKGKDFIKGVEILKGQSFSSNVCMSPAKKITKNQNFQEKCEYTKEYNQLREIKEGSPAYNYLQMRGISLSLAQEYGAKYAPYNEWPNYNKKGESIRQWKPGRLVFPITDMANSKAIQNLYGRTIEWKGFVPKDKKLYKNFKHDQLKGAKGIFNFNPDVTPFLDCVIFTESILDALSLVEYFPQYKDKVLGTFGANSLNWDLFKNVKHFLFAFDPDEAGENHPLINKAKEEGKTVWIVNKSFYKGFDLNEYWIEFKTFSGFRKNIKRL